MAAGCGSCWSDFISWCKAQLLIMLGVPWCQKRERNYVEVSRPPVALLLFCSPTLSNEELCSSIVALLTTLTIGSCTKGPSCRYIHDPSKVAICQEFLRDGTCTAGTGCDLSHESTYERVPACWHFLRSNCSNASCRYAHVKLNLPPSTPICKAFTRLGYCSKGIACPNRHVFECPDYAARGACQRQSCRMPHVDRAGQIRKQTSDSQYATTASSSMEDSDLSSGEDEDIDSDVDSETFDYDFAKSMDDPDSGLSLQHDFVHL
jgi:hypothetical protein